MAGESALDNDFEADRAAGEPAFKVDLDGFEGPLDLLLELARRQKVDLARISILELANQYLSFVEAARKLRLELAADYLVMAAWLAYLKSRLLLPVPPKAEAQDAAGMADALAQRLRRLEQIRRAAEVLMNLPRVGRDVFRARGARSDRLAGESHVRGDALRLALRLCASEPEAGAGPMSACKSAKSGRSPKRVRR